MYIGPDSEKLPDPFFESGVCKIQNGLTSLLTEEEKMACRHLEEPGADHANNIALTFADVVEKTKSELQAVRYCNCNCILGSVAEVERLWSIAKNILTPSRNNTSDELFECIIFLKINKNLWDKDLVRQAIDLSRTHNADNDSGDEDNGNEDAETDDDNNNNDQYRLNDSDKDE